MFMTHVNDRGELEICFFDDDDDDGDSVGEATLAVLIDNWIDDEALDGELHPYLDGTLPVLAALNAAQQRIVQALEADDPHRADMTSILDSMGTLLQRIMTALED
jgi:hypothetical protein